MKEFVLILFVFSQLFSIHAIKFAYKSLNIENSKGQLVAKIPIQGVVPRMSLPPASIEKAAIFLPGSNGDACDLAILIQPQIRIKNLNTNYEAKEHLLLVNALNCDLPTKIENAYNSGYTGIVFHNLAKDRNPASIVLDASDVQRKCCPIPVYFIGQKHGRLILDIFAFPKRFMMKIENEEKPFYLTRYEDALEEEIMPPKLTIETSISTPKNNEPWFKVRTQQELGEMLETYCSIPPFLAFFGGMLLWLIQGAFTLTLLFGTGCVGLAGLICVCHVIFTFYDTHSPRAVQTEEEQVQVIRDQMRRHAEESFRRIQVLNARGIQTLRNYDAVREVDENLLRRVQVLIQNMRAGNNLQAVGPVTAEVVDSLQKIEAPTTDVCAICLEDIVIGEILTTLEPSCQHLFHTPCIEHWLSVKGNCPKCRRLVTGNLTEID